MATLFYKVVEMSIAACCIGLGVLLLRKIADKRISPFWKNALWLLVLVALVVPYRPSSNVAVLPQTSMAETAITPTPVVTTPSVGHTEPPHTSVGQGLAPAASWDFVDLVLPTIWLLGMVVMMGILFVTRQKMSRGMRTTTGRPYDALLSDCKRQFNITQSVEIVEQSYLKSPALWGLFRPKILLPDYVSEMSQESQKYILLHELSHLKHHDLWKNTLLLALQIVYWFNPLVWVLFRFIRQDMELLNDQRVLKTLEKSEETPYAMSLIEVLGHANKLPLAPQMLCMVDNKGNTKRRIQMIQLGEMFKKHKIIIAVGCLAVIGVLSALFLTAQPEKLEGTYICTDAEAYGGFYPYATLELKQNGTYTFQFASNSSATAQGKYTHTGTQLKLSFEDVELDRTYVFDVVENGFSLDLTSCENPAFNAVDFPDGAVFVPNTTGTETITEIKKVIHTQMADLTHDGISDVIETSITIPFDGQDKSLEALLNMTLPCDIAVYDTVLSTNTPIYQQSYGAPHTANGQLSLVEVDGLSYLLEGSLYAGQGFYTFAHSIFFLDSQGNRQVQAEDSAEGQLSDGDAATKIQAYFSNLTPWIEGATAIAILDVNLENQMVSTEDETYLVKDYYEAMAAYYHSQMAFAPQPLMDLANDPNITIVDYVPVSDMGYDTMGMVCYTYTGDDGVYVACFNQNDSLETANKVTLGASGGVVVTEDSKLKYLGNGICEIELQVLFLDEMVTYTIEFYEESSRSGTRVSTPPEFDPQPLTADELSYFNDNYFDILHDQEDYYVHFRSGLRLGNTVQLVFRGYVPETGDVYEMIEEILTLEQVGDEYIFVGRDFLY